MKSRKDGGGPTGIIRSNFVDAKIKKCLKKTSNQGLIDWAIDIVILSWYILHD